MVMSSFESTFEMAKILPVHWIKACINKGDLPYLWVKMSEISHCHNEVYWQGAERGVITPFRSGKTYAVSQLSKTFLIFQIIFIYVTYYLMFIYVAKNSIYASQMTIGSKKSSDYRLGTPLYWWVCWLKFVNNQYLTTTLLIILSI